MTTTTKTSGIRKRVATPVVLILSAVLCQGVAAGDDNDSDSQVFLEQIGENTVEILESGDDNRISVNQVNVSGSNSGVVALAGEDNRASLEQNGGYLNAVVSLNDGEDNRFNLRQRGERSRLSLLLEGDRNRFDVDQGLTSQARSLALNVTVSGNGNRGMLSQSGGGHSMAMSVLGSGNGIFARQQ